MQQLLLRAQLLISQNRYQQAEEVLGQVLASDPNQGTAHAWMAICQLQDRDRLDSATREVETAIHLQPDDDFPYYVRAVVMLQRNRWDEGLESIQQALALNPGSSTYYGLEAQVFANQKKWKACLNSAEQGLQCDPDDEQCRAFRSLALERLGRLDDATEEARIAIQRDPDSSMAHASLGWSLLNSGDHLNAQKSFREALRLEPSNEFARSGMIQALNSSSFIFRSFMKLMQMLSRLDSRTQWILIIGLWVGVQALNGFARQNPWFLPYVIPISVAYLLLVMMTWIAVPLFNTFLRFHSFGKHLLTQKEKWASNSIAIAIGLGVAMSVFYLALLTTLGVDDILLYSLLPILFSIYLTVPISVAFDVHDGWPSWVAWSAVAGFSLLFLVIGILWLFPGPLVMSIVKVYLYGILIYCFAGNYLRTVQPKL